MTIKSLSYLSSKSQSPVSTYTKNNRRVTEGYDASNASFWYRIELGQVREFSSRGAMEKALDLELTPIVRIPDLPLLPANIPSSAPRQSIARVMACYGHSIPSQGIIYLPAPAPKKTTKPAKPAQAAPLTRPQQKVAAEFLEEASEYFKLLSEIDNTKMNQRDWHNTKWHLTCAFERMSGRAFTFAMMVSQGVH